jgi:hypothetical protein
VVRESCVSSVPTVIGWPLAEQLVKGVVLTSQGIILPRKGLAELRKILGQRRGATLDSSPVRTQSASTTTAYRS